MFNAKEIDPINIICSSKDLWIHLKVEKFKYKPIAVKVSVYGAVTLLKKRSIKKPLKIKK